MDRAPLWRRVLGLAVAGLGAGAMLTFALVPAQTHACQPVVASWYGPGFHGRLTASGERFDQNAMTAAHKSLPFGTRLRVSYRGRSVTVRVNDRGPFVRGRNLDLSRAAAERLGLMRRGVATVCKTRLD